MAAKPAGNNPVDGTVVEGSQLGPSRHDAPPRGVFWLAIIAAAVGGLMLGSLFFTAAYVAQATAHQIAFGITAGACLILQPLLVWLFLRWMWSALDEERLVQTGE